MILCSSPLSFCKSHTHRSSFDKHRDPRARICIAVLCLLPHHPNAQVSQSFRLVAEAPYLTSHTGDWKHTGLSPRYVEGPCSGPRDNNSEFGICTMAIARVQQPSPLLPLNFRPPKCSNWAGNAIAAVSLQGKAVAWQHLER